ncbi:uncharacterized protein [Venturia canescens]|uniref:uncharacterized protein n=1 Tax=Venturia canescens TaxID=32260 RepID=UPI001C9C9EAF|nr:uncharacterized protein LOC122417968 [Venturia canescens]
MTSLKAILLAGICTLFLVTKSMGQETETSGIREKLLNSGKLMVVAKKMEEIDGGLREKRAPQFDEDYDDYSDVAESRHLRFGHRRRKHRKPHYHGGQGGCRGHGCYQGYGWQPQQGGYYNQGQGFASATAGSNFFPNGGGQSQANAQSATFSFGPYSATFSHAEASSGNRRPLSFFAY